MATIALREHLQSTLHGFQQGSLKENALALLEQLGYRSDKQIDLEPNTVATFKDTFEVPEHVTFNDEKALVEQWQSVDFLFQLAGDDLAIGGQLPLVRSQAVDTSASAWQSYLFFAIHLRDRDRPYTRTELANITREVNKLFPMPAMVIFQQGQTLTLSVINRRLNKRYPERDVLEKVTLIKDINLAHPHRAHLEILADLASDELYRVQGFTTFEELHRAWQTVLDSSELNKKFFKEVADWYFWATDKVAFPKGLEGRNSNEMSLIRLITRLIFVWFLKEKGLVSDRLFNPRELQSILKSVKADESTYYWAILQNLFFATLNQEADNRQFCENAKFRKGYNPNRLSTNLYRHQDLFRAADEAEILGLFQDIPFLNGGLFECLDEEVKRNGETIVQRVDGFSRNPKEAAQVPNRLFFQEEPLTVDLNATYDTKGKRYTVRGLLSILNTYKFTVTENTPIEEEIALDPELLGQVFENLLAAYNPETQTTARKKTGSFYTPREVVDYMVDESLVTYFKSQVTNDQTSEAELSELDGKLRRLVDYGGETNPFTDDPATTIELIAAINRLKALDPAVGSGAFPMGMLQKLVMILRKLDPDNHIWKHEQREKLIGDEVRKIKQDVALAQQISDEEVRETAIRQLQERLERLEAEFANQDMDYPRKLFLIENCIYGVDIQNIAVQIAKLRCFIALIVEQTVDDRQPNRGIFPLPNLEMKFVAANTLFALEKAEQLSLLGSDIALKEKETELEQLRHDYFQTYDLGKKRRLKEKDEALRGEIATLLQSQNVSKSSAEKIAYWKPYDQLAEADFFDPHWMFGIEAGFDIVIGNPPYVRQEQIKAIKPQLKPLYECYTGVADLYVYFFERGLQLLKPGGVLTYICSNKYFRANYGEKLRHLLSQKTRIQTLIDFGDAPVFTAIAYPSIIVTQQSRPNGNAIAAMNWETERPVEDFIEVFADHKFDLAQTYLGKDGWQLESPAVFNLLEKLRAAGKPLGEYVNGRFYRGIVTGYNQAFVVDRATRDALIAADPSSAEVLKPFVRGRDVKRWRVNYQDLWLIFTRRGIRIKNHPAIHDYLSQFKERLTPGIKGGRKAGSYEWYEIQDNIAYWREFDQPKIFYQEIATYQAFAWDESGAYSNNKTFLIPGADSYLLALLNSKIVWFFLSNTVQKMAGGAFALQTIYIEHIPIPPASDADKATITALVQKCLDAKGQGVAQWEAEIDDRVAQLYGLTPDDLKIIHGD